MGKGLLARTVLIFDHASDIDKDATRALGIHGSYGHGTINPVVFCCDTCDTIPAIG